MHIKSASRFVPLVKVIYSEKTTKFCKVFTFFVLCTVPVKSKVQISQNFVAFSKYMNFKSGCNVLKKFCNLLHLLRYLLWNCTGKVKVPKFEYNRVTNWWHHQSDAIGAPACLYFKQWGQTYSYSISKKIRKIWSLQLLSCLFIFL